MITLWGKNDNSSLSVGFEKPNKSNILYFDKSNYMKYVDSFKHWKLKLFGLNLEYVNFECDDIIHVEIKSENNYTNVPDGNTIRKLKATLMAHINSNTWGKAKMPFNWNFEMTDENQYTFYITAPKQWFIDNGMESLTTPLREIVGKDTIPHYKFPDYDPMYRTTTQFLGQA